MEDDKGGFMGRRSLGAILKTFSKHHDDLKVNNPKRSTLEESFSILQIDEVEIQEEEYVIVSERQILLEQLPAMVSGVLSDDLNLQLEMATQFRKLLSTEGCPLIQEVIKSGVVPRFVEFLMREDFPQLQFEAVCSLTKITSGTSEHLKLVADFGAIPNFVKLLGSPSYEVREQVLWALGNFAADYRDLVLGHNALPRLLSLFNEHANLSMLRNAIKTLSKLCKGRPQAPLCQIGQIRPALPALQLLIHLDDEKVLRNACWALTYLCPTTYDGIQAVIDAGLCPRLVELLGHSSPSVVKPALCMVCKIVMGDDTQKQIVINHQALPRLLNLLSSNNKTSIQSCACWTISNITAGNVGQIQAVIDANIFGTLVHLLHIAKLDVKKEAAAAVVNATSSATPAQIKYLASQGCIKPLCDILACSDPAIVKVCLNGLENILMKGVRGHRGGVNGGNRYAKMIEDAERLKKIEALEFHENKGISERAVKILKTYW